MGKLKAAVVLNIKIFCEQVLKKKKKRYFVNNFLFIFSLRVEIKKK